MEGIGEHRHCRVCGKPSPLDREVCSKACRATLDSRQSTKQNYAYIMYALIVVFVLLLVLQLFHL